MHICICTYLILLKIIAECKVYIQQTKYNNAYIEELTIIDIWLQINYLPPTKIQLCYNLVKIKKVKCHSKKVTRKKETECSQHPADENPADKIPSSQPNLINKFKIQGTLILILMSKCDKIRSIWLIVKQSIKGS